MAHQRTKQIESANVLDALSNCAIRFANSDEEARYLAPRLRTSEDFLQSLSRGKFAAFVRDMAPQAVAVSVNRVDFEQHRMLSFPEQNALAERMRAEYGTPRAIAPPASPENGSPEAAENVEVSDVAEPAQRPDLNFPQSEPAQSPASPNPIPNEHDRKPRSSKNRPPGGSASKAGESTEGATDWH